MRAILGKHSWSIIGIALLAGAAASPPPVWACEPIIPFVKVLMPAANLWELTHSAGVVLLAVVILKSLLFAVFEKHLPRLQAATFMLVGNILTSIIGTIAAVMLGSGATTAVGIPVVWLLCLFPSRRLVQAAPHPWFDRRSARGVATLMTVTFLASLWLFTGITFFGGGSIAYYWLLKLAAVYCALIASIALTTVWEEWVVWQLASRPANTHYFAAVLRTNVYVLLVVMAIAAAFMLPKRLKSPDFLSSVRLPATSMTR